MKHSKRTENIMNLARYAAWTLQDKEVEFKHVVLATVYEGTSVTAKVLAQNGVTMETLAEDLGIKDLYLDQEPVSFKNSGFLDRILEEAAQEAMELESNQLCPAHIVLAALEQLMAWFFSSQIRQRVWQNRAEIRAEIIEGLIAKELRSAKT